MAGGMIQLVDQQSNKFKDLTLNPTVTKNKNKKKLGLLTKPT
jgi:hypothetical protein